MNRFPRIVLHLDRVAQNAGAVINLCRQHSVQVTAITKGVCGDARIAALLTECGIDSLGDSRLQNLENYSQLPCPKWLIRIPMLSECADVVRLADVSLVSESATLQVLNRAAQQQKKKHGVLLMVEMGDRREGCVDASELEKLIDQVDEYPGLYLKGIGTNLGCYGFIRTTDQKMREFSQIVQQIAGERPLTVSGGNSSALRWLMEAENPGRINHLRLGESILFGRERRDFSQLPGTQENAFILQAEIVEIKRKPSLPDGEIGRDSFGVSPHFQNAGEHTRAICAVGRQDVEPDVLVPEDDSVKILGASSDHMLLELAESKYRLGDVLSFRMRYPAVVRAMTSKYVTKQYSYPE
jgi:ornithine racemase